MSQNLKCNQKDVLKSENSFSNCSKNEIGYLETLSVHIPSQGRKNVV